MSDMSYPRLDLSFYTLEELEDLAVAALTEDRKAADAVIAAHNDSERVREATKRFLEAGRDEPLFPWHSGMAL